MFFIKYFAIVAIAVAVEAQQNEADATDLINDINHVVLVKNAKTCVIFVCDGNIMFVATEADSVKLFKELGVPLEEVQIFRDTYEAFNPIDILMKLAKLRAQRSTFVVYFTEEDETKPVTKPTPTPTPSPSSNSPLPESIIKEINDIVLLIKSETIVIFVRDGAVKFVSTQPDSKRLLKKFEINPDKTEIIRDTFENNNPTELIYKLNNYRLSRPTFLIYFKEARPKPPGPRPIGLLVPEYLIYDINDLLLVQKVKTIVIFVRNGRVQFATQERDVPSKLARLGYSPDKLKVIKDTFESFNPFDILGKLARLRYDTDTFLVYFTEVPGTEFPELSGLINDISDVVLVRKSRTCVILVSGGRIKFVTTEEEVAQKKKELGISDNGIEIIKETFERKNPYDILGKLAELRSKRDTFLVYFIEGKPTQSPGYVFPESLINDINDILLVKKSKTVAIYVLDGRIEFVTTEPDAAGKLAEQGTDPKQLEVINDTYEPLDPYDILGKLAKYLSRLNTFLIIFTEATGTQYPEFAVLLNDISDVILAKNSKTCVIYVSGGKIIFITTEPDAPKQIAKYRVPIKTIETIRESFESRNPFDILGKLIQILSSRDTFLVYFTAGLNRPSGQGRFGFRLPGFNLPGFQLPGFRLPGFNLSGLQGFRLPNLNLNLKLPGLQFLNRPLGGSVSVETTKSNGGIFGLAQKAMGLAIGTEGIVPLHLDIFGLKPNKKVVSNIKFRG